MSPFHQCLHGDSTAVDYTWRPNKVQEISVWLNRQWVQWILYMRVIVQYMYVQLYMYRSLYMYDCMYVQIAINIDPIWVTYFLHLCRYCRSIPPSLRWINCSLHNHNRVYQPSQVCDTRRRGVNSACILTDINNSSTILLPQWKLVYCGVCTR